LSGTIIHCNRTPKNGMWNQQRKAISHRCNSKARKCVYNPSI